MRRGGGIGGPSRTGYMAAPREKGMCSSWSAAVDGEDVGIEDIAGVRCRSAAGAGQIGI